ncbi:hypothetical protein PVIIG_00656 [Plasmodium vivax India VII]|uniref:Uncharacterized protein n=1 Tax=Plasmodium vivax India VII TaxID=1077284 RepID=A0A0J9S5B3_PLAVI|nr:hypothetical protein PVIIG_00656 [Plasmodium vivax India VII]
MKDKKAKRVKPPFRVSFTVCTTHRTWGKKPKRKEFNIKQRSACGTRTIPTCGGGAFLGASFSFFCDKSVII